MPSFLSKTFNIPFSGGAATVVCLFKYSLSDDPSSAYKGVNSVQYNADGTTVNFRGSADAALSVSVNNGVMTVALEYARMVQITDCRCCLIPGDPFA